MSNRKLKIKPALVTRPEIRILAPGEISSFWDRIVPGLDRIIDRSDGVDWRKEDIYHALKIGSAIILVDPNAWQGFLICSPMDTFAGRVLWLWAAYGEKTADIDAYWALLNEFAREEGFDRIHFATQRRGMARAAKRYGYRAMSIVYEKQVM